MGTSRGDRQQAIVRLVRSRQIRTQAELVYALQGEGFDVTQATVSRDIADLDLRKDKSGVYLLAEDERFRALVASAVRETRRAENLLVVITGPGAAQSVAASIDAAAPEGVLGSIAGDDTILVIGADEASCIRFQQHVDSLLAARN